jgi:signal peptidase II
MRAGSHARWLWLTLAILAADRATKLAIERCTSEDLHHVLVPGFVTLVHSRNPGIAFGMLAGARAGWLNAALIAGTFVVVVLLAWVLLAGRAGTARTQAGIALILGGAAGNLIDRLLHGGVTDFFEIHVRSFYWPAFNVADSAIFIGALLVALDLLRGQRHG